jgi:beta-phosphoglucomutase
MGELRAVYAEFLESHGRRPGEAGFDTLIGATVREIVDRVCADRGAAERAGALAHYRGLLARRYASRVVPMPGAGGLIARARAAGVRLGLVTSAEAPLVRAFLDTHGWGDAFDVVITGDAGGSRKPDPAPYQAALARLGLPARDELAVEDSPAGVRSAVAAGVRTVGLATRHSARAQQLRAAGAADVVDSLEDVAAVLTGSGA